ncbi:MAG: hypothetical protein IJY33_04825, partial [Oscillospiraceae bacterium]|nr:hypothetical protein [Oscillospiraceae bacterium]
VIADGGMVGIVTEVGDNYAKVTTIISDGINVSAKFGNVSELCIVEGDLKLIDDEIGKNDYVEYNTKRKITDISWDYIEYTIPYEAKVSDWDTWEEKAKYSGTRIVSFRFDLKQFRGEVYNVIRQ